MGYSNIICTLHQAKANKIGRTCSTHEEEKLIFVVCNKKPVVTKKTALQTLHYVDRILRLFTFLPFKNFLDYVYVVMCFCKMGRS
jgi:hypothetical protein